MLRCCREQMDWREVMKSVGINVPARTEVKAQECAQFRNACSIHDVTRTLADVI